MFAELIKSEPNFMTVNISTQQMQVFERGLLAKEYLISTAKNGPGEQLNSECTPRGLHLIRAKIGANAVINSVFIRRRWTGECYSELLASQQPGRDWILSRILWLSGCEVGKNRLGRVDTMRRYIYIHGTPDCVPMGQPGSRGCIRMRNKDMVELFDLIPIYTKLLILP